MSFVIFEGDFIPSKVEVAGTEPNLLIPLISLTFQTTIWQLVSDFNHLTAISLSKLLLYLYYIQNSLFNLFTVLSDTSVSLATFRIG